MIGSTPGLVAQRVHASGKILRNLDSAWAVPRALRFVFFPDTGQNDGGTVGKLGHELQAPAHSLNGLPKG